MSSMSTAKECKFLDEKKETAKCVDQRKSRKVCFVLGMLFFGLVGTVRMSSALDVGDQAPDFSLPATTGGKISLSQFRGKKLVLIEFYGADYSPV